MIILTAIWMIIMAVICTFEHSVRGFNWGFWLILIGMTLTWILGIVAYLRHERLDDFMYPNDDEEFMRPNIARDKIE